MQNELFKKKWSKLDGYNKKSFHQSGFAIDIFLLINGRPDYSDIDRYWEMKELFFIQFEKMKTLGIFPPDSYIRSGMDWNRNNIRVDRDIKENFMDMPHFELRNIT